MKKLVLAVTLAAVASTANAGGMEEPVVTPKVMTEVRDDDFAGI